MRVAVFAGILALFIAIGWANGAPRVVSGDEPHYLLAVNSLLRDHDLLLGDDYRRVQGGSAEAGVDFRGSELDHHTILVAPDGSHELWQRVFDWRTHLPGGGFARLQPGFDSAAEFPAHPAAFPALVALVLAPFRIAPGRLEPWAIGVVAIISFLSLIAIHAAALRAGFTAGEALCTALLAAAASPMLAYARSFFSEPAIALALALSAWALAARKPALCGALAFAAAAIKPPFGLVAFGWAALRFRQGVREEALRLLTAFSIGCAALLAFNLRLAHTPIISGTTGFVPAEGPSSLGLIFFGNRHGLFAYAPWTAAGLVAAARAKGGLLRDLAWAAAPVLFVFAITDVEAGGYCYGPRYFIPFIPWLALCTVAAWRDASRGLRAVIGAGVLLSAAIAIPGAVRYRHLFDRPSVAAFRR